MTVAYTSRVATERTGGFFRLLFRWRGSIYSVLYGEIAIFICLYYLISITYRFLLTVDQRKIFEGLCVYFNQFADYVPVTFVVGFYVIRLIARRWTQWENIPWPDKFAFDVSSYVLGTDFHTRMMRRTLVRYVNLASVLCFRDICLPVKKRFPTLEHLISAGLMTVPELEIYESTCSKRDSNWWIPFHWSYTLLTRAYKEGKIAPEGFVRLQDRIIELRDKCWVLFSHDWIQVPMVYTQVATLSVYMFMFASLFGRQYIEGKKSASPVELYVPFFTILQTVFYLGWLKVGEVLISPMGMDADDFEINYIIDRCLNPSLQLSYSVVDYNFNKLPPLEKDLHWDCGTDAEMPHTEESQGLNDNPFKGSVAQDPMDFSEDRKGSMVPSGITEFVRRFSVQHSDSMRSTGRTRTPSLVQNLTSYISRQFSRTSDSDDPSRTQPVSADASPRLKKVEFSENGQAVDAEICRQESYDRKHGAYQNRLSNIQEVDILDLLASKEVDSAAVKESRLSDIEEVDVLDFLASEEKVDQVNTANGGSVSVTAQTASVDKSSELDQIVIKRS